MERRAASGGEGGRSRCHHRERRMGRSGRSGGGRSTDGADMALLRETAAAAVVATAFLAELGLGRGIGRSCVKVLHGVNCEK